VQRLAGVSVTSASASRVALGAIRRRLRLDQQARALSAISVWAAAGLFLAGCAFQARPLADDDGGQDGGGDVMGCAWAAHFDACALRPFPTQALVLNGPTRWTFNTGTGSFGPMVPAGAFLTTQLSVNGGRSLLVLYSSAFTLGAGATLTVTGPQPLVIAADSMIEIEGDLDAGSHGGDPGPPATGPGANDIACLGDLDGGVGGGNGGGGGGALAASGGPGGANNKNGPGGSAGGQVSAPAFVRGGCAGGTGGGDRNTGRGGNGGGAIELAARGGITVTGHITAGGAGGTGGGSQKDGVDSGGGGGGGSGGMISFQAPSVRLTSTAFIVANGGGGGAGGAHDDGGHSGDDGPLAATSASGGEPGSGRAGGDGGALTTASGGAGTGGGGDDGGGGGGGSVGYVMVRSGSFAATNAVVSPPASRL
jgi:hypothetical protein